MELSVHKDTVLSYQGSIDTTFEMPIETEILVPDYVAEVFKIVKCTVGHTIFQKQLSAGKVVIEGYHKVSVFYQTQESSAVYSLEQKLPFSKTFDYKGENASRYRITVFGECEYLNCRAINQRRIDVRGAYSMTAGVKAFKDIEVMTGISGDEIEQKLSEITYTKYLTRAEKQFTTESEIEFYETPQKILYTFCSAVATSCEVVGHKLVVKGEVRVNVSYISNQDTFIKEAKTLAVNQVIDIDEEYTATITCPIITVSNCTILSGEDEGVYSVTVTCACNIDMYDDRSVLIVTDAFCTENNYETTYNSVDLLCAKEKINCDVGTVINAPVDDEFCEIVDCFASVGQVELGRNDNGMYLTGHITTHLICENTMGELTCFDNISEYRISTNCTITEDTCFEITPTLLSINASTVGREATVEFTVSLCGVVFEKRSFIVLEQITTTEEPILNSTAALCIYFAEAGELVFDIAKKYGASPTMIRTHNNLTEEVLQAKQRLIVPV